MVNLPEPVGHFHINKICDIYVGVCIRENYKGYGRITHYLSSVGFIDRIDALHAFWRFLGGA